MRKNKGNTIIIALLVTWILSIILTAASSIVYLIYFRVIELKDQIYLNINSNSYNNKLIADYTNNPLWYFWDRINNKNINFKHFSRYEDYFEETISPWEESMFFLTNLEIENNKNIYSIKKINLFYNKWLEDEDLSIGFVRWEKNNIKNFKTWNILLKKDENICISNCNFSWSTSTYKNNFIISDFTSSLDTNKYNYWFFFNSANWVTYSIWWLDSENKKTQIPSKYITIDFSMNSLNKKITSNIKNKINLYSNYSINISKSLYDIH